MSCPASHFMSSVQPFKKTAKGQLGVKNTRSFRGSLHHKNDRFDVIIFLNGEIKYFEK